MTTKTNIRVIKGYGKCVALTTNQTICACDVTIDGIHPSTAIGCRQSGIWKQFYRALKKGSK